MSDSFHCDSAYTDGFGLLPHKTASVFHSIGQPFHRHSYNSFPRACNSPDPILREFPWRPIGGEGEGERKRHISRFFLVTSQPEA
jgi:hypothetical protein